jgi:adenylate cyclase
VMRIGLVSERGTVFPDALATGPWPESVDVERAALVIRGRHVGVVEFARPSGRFDERDRALVRTLAAEVAISLENTRLYAQLDTLFRQYLSPDVAETLIADPSQAALGGAVVEVTALFADLRGFTTFSERSAPDAIVAMLNRYFGLAVPVILGLGGTVVQFQGDAVLAIFNAPARQADHRLRAVQAGLGMQRAIEGVAAANPEFPRFRVGVNTGPALVGNVGSDELRSFNVMGDAVNVAARLEAIAEPGTVVIGASTYLPIADLIEVEPLGDLTLKGKEELVEAYVVRRVR